jgi:hypothetical protein
MIISIITARKMRTTNTPAMEVRKTTGRLGCIFKILYDDEKSDHFYHL